MPVLVKQLSAEDVLKVALIENIQRQILIDRRSVSYKRLLEQHSLTQEKFGRIPWQESGYYRELSTTSEASELYFGDDRKGL